MIDPNHLEELKAKARAAHEAGRLELPILSDTPQAWVEYFRAFNTTAILSLIAELERARKDAESLREVVRRSLRVMQIAAQGKGGKQHVYLESRIGHFVECETAIKECEKALSAQEGEAERTPPTKPRPAT